MTNKQTHAHTTLICRRLASVRALRSVIYSFVIPYNIYVLYVYFKASIKINYMIYSFNTFLLR